MRKSNRYIILNDPHKRLQWIVHLYCKVKIEHTAMGFEFSFMQEDGGAYERFPAWKKENKDLEDYFEGKTLKEVIDKGWEYAKVENLVQHCLALQNKEVDYRKLNFPDHTDEELGIKENEASHD